jgi:hypothetical protein
LALYLTAAETTDKAMSPSRAIISPSNMDDILKRKQQNPLFGYYRAYCPFSPFLPSHDLKYAEATTGGSRTEDWNEKKTPLAPQRRANVFESILPLRLWRATSGGCIEHVETSVIVTEDLVLQKRIEDIVIIVIVISRARFEDARRICKRRSGIIRLLLCVIAITNITSSIGGRNFVLHTVRTARTTMTLVVILHVGTSRRLESTDG